MPQVVGIYEKNREQEDPKYKQLTKNTEECLDKFRIIQAHPFIEKRCRSGSLPDLYGDLDFPFLFLITLVIIILIRLFTVNNTSIERELFHQNNNLEISMKRRLKTRLIISGGTSSSETEQSLFRENENTAITAVEKFEAPNNILNKLEYEAI